MNLAEAEQRGNELRKGEDELMTAVGKKLIEIEKGYKEWSAEETMKWISMMEQGRFRAPKFSTFIEKLSKMNIDGQQLAELNSKFALNMAGLKHANDQAILRKHINRVVAPQPTDNRNLCGICVKNKVDTVMLPCGHQYHCYECIQRMSVQQRRMCPICRKSVSQIIKTFMSGFPDR